MDKNECITIPEPGRVEIRELPMPQAASGHALLRLKYGGICGSDLGTYRGTFLYADYPRIPGHEFAAEVVEVDTDNAQGIRPGMLVTGNPYFNCGSCYSCVRGYVNCCTANQTMGAQRDGAFCRYLSMPVERLYSGEGLPAETLALIEPYCISYHAAKLAAVRPGERVLVVGGGAIGHLAAAAAVRMGGEVTVADISARKLALTEGLGIAHTVCNAAPGALKEAVERLTGGRGFDVCIECVGLPATFQACIDAAAFRGRVVVVGIGKQSLNFFYSVIQTKELQIFGSRNALPEDFRELIGLAREGGFDLGALVSARYAFADAGKAFADLSDRGSDLLKVMIEF